VVLDVLPGLVRAQMTESMPAWDGVTDWDEASAAAAVVVDNARGRYDHRACTILDAIELGYHGEGQHLE
jgi:hypothetical protein